MAMTFRMSVLSLSLFYLYAGASAHLLRRRERVHAVRRYGLHGHDDLGAVAPAGRGPGARDLNGVFEHPCPVSVLAGSDGRASPAQYERNAQPYPSASNPRIISSLRRSAGDPVGAVQPGYRIYEICRLPCRPSPVHGARLLAHRRCGFLQSAD